MSTNEARVYFALYGDDFEPEELTSFLGIEPTSIKRKGSRVPGKIPKQSSWQYSLENVVGEYVDIYALSAELIETLKPIKSLILQAIDRFDVKSQLNIVLVISINEEHSTPAIGFEVDTIEFLGEIGASVDIDCYTTEN